MEHQIKCWPEYFKAIVDGTKNFEVRNNDRDYQVGDRLYLAEWEDDKYTGMVVTKPITYVLEGGQFGIEAGYVVLGLGGMPGADD